MQEGRSSSCSKLNNKTGKELTLRYAQRMRNCGRQIPPKAQIPVSSTDPGSEHTPNRPIDRTERQALATGAAEQLLSDLQQELQTCKQQKEDLQHQLHQGVPPTTYRTTDSAFYPNTEVYRRLLDHTQPLQTVMQYYHAYWAIDLLTSNLPLPKKGTTLRLLEFQELWENATSRAKDTLAFMWTVGDIKLPLGTIEVVAGSPPFFIRRYILRSIAGLAQHQAAQDKGYNINQTLPTLRPYNHSQKMEITKLQYKHEIVFQTSHRDPEGEDTTICYEAVRRQQWLLEHHPEKQTNVTTSSAQGVCHTDFRGTTNHHNEEQSSARSTTVLYSACRTAQASEFQGQPGSVKHEDMLLLRRRR